MPLQPQTLWPVSSTVQSLPLLNALASLKKTRPRLLWKEGDRARILKLLQRSEEARTVHEALLAHAEVMLSAPTVAKVQKEREKGAPADLWDARAVLDRAYTLGFLHLLTGEIRYSKRLRRELLEAAWMESWTKEYDLHNAEMLHAFAIGLDWVGDTLNEKERGVLQSAVVEKSLKLAEIAYAVRPWWMRDPCNWNTVCNGAVIIGALALAEAEPRLCAHLLANGMHHITSSLETFAPDGGWPEGPGYWSFASRYLAPTISGLETALGTCFKLDQMPGLAQAGAFRTHMEGPFGKYFNFSDSYEDAIAEPCLFWYSKRYSKPELALAARHSMKAIRKPYTFGSAARALLWWDESGSEKHFAKQPRQAWFRAVDVFSMRSTWNDPQAWYLASKGGDVQVNHGQCDLGTFVLDAHGVRWVLDLGPDNYALPGYFDGRPDKGYKRWAHYRLQAQGHNTLIINDSNQHVLATAPALGFAHDKFSARGVLDLTSAYRDHPVTRAWRGFKMRERVPSVVIRDEIDLSAQAKIAFQFHTQAKVELSSDSVLLSKEGQTMRVDMQSSSGGKWRVEEIVFKAPQNEMPNLRKLVFETSARKGTHSLTAHFTALNAPLDWTSRALKDWKI